MACELERAGPKVLALNAKSWAARSAALLETEDFLEDFLK